MNSVTELGIIIKNLETIITDEDIKELNLALKDIRQRYENTASVIILIKMVQTLIKYLSSKKEKAHADSMPLLQSISGNLEKIINTPYLEDNEVNKIISEQTREYKLFQSKITSNPTIPTEDIDNLKAVILAIDWEISDTTLESFDTVVSQMISKYKNYKIHYSFLKIMHATGKFIGVQKASAPANSISFLRSVFDNFHDIVETKEMPFKEKRRLIEQDMERFQDFKQDISKQKKTNAAGPDTDPAGDDRDEDGSEVMPALSHVKSSNDTSEEEFGPLIELDEDESSLEAEKNGQESLHLPIPGNGLDPDEQKDVMDDLFTVKDSPADDLLDAIHLMEVHGDKGQNQAMKMLDQADEDQAGLKNFRPERKDTTTPIPEIDSRLDAFFSLDEPDQADELETIEDTQSLDDISEQALEKTEDVSESITPFELDDESFEEMIPENDAEKIFSPDLILLNKLKDAFVKKEYLEDEAVLDSIQEDIQGLRKMWADDSQKQSLLDIISISVNLPSSVSPATEEPNTEVETDEFMETGQDLPGAESKGVLGKIKSMFTR